MTFSALYDAVQGINGKISTKWLRDEAIRLSEINKIKEQWTGAMDESFIRGFYIEGPLGPPVSLLENESLIVLPRSLDKHHRRFVYTKELMHVFDVEEEKADTTEKFDAQAERFRDPTAESTPQFRAESKAFWRALAVLCQEKRRLELKAAIDDGKMSLEVAATALQLPPKYVRNLFREDFPKIVRHIRS